MANYYAHTKSNWCRVTDEMKFKNLLNNVSVFSESGDNKLYHHSYKGSDDLYVHKLMCYGELTGKYNEDIDNFEDIEEKFYKPLQDLLPTNSDIFVSKYIGHEKLRSLDAGYVIVTKEDIKYGSIDRAIDSDVEELTGCSDIPVDFDATDFNVSIEVIDKGEY